QVLRWVYWWNSTEDVPDSITSEDVLVQLNTDFSTKGMDSQELQAVVAAWQCGAISRDTMFELFRKGEILPDGRTNEDEAELIGRLKAEGQTLDGSGTYGTNASNRTNSSQGGQGNNAR